MLSLQQICQVTDGSLIGNPKSEFIQSYHFDTRQLGPDSMFIALTGGARDGHLFLNQAREHGAVVALISDEKVSEEHPDFAFVLVKDTEKAFAHIASYYRSTLHIPIIAITGSNGKTTTKDIISHVLSFKKKVYKTYKNLNNHLGVPLSLLQIQPDHEIAVLEMGMNHAGEIDFLGSIAKPNISVIINVNDAHIEHLGSRENIAKAKAELLPHTDPEGFVVLNGDNSYVVNISSLYGGKTYFYRLTGESDIFATDIVTSDDGTSFTVHVGETISHFTIPMFGTHIVSNCLPAIIIALQFGYSPDEIRQALKSLDISPMRFQLMQEVQKTTIINDAYNASPTSMKTSIATFSEILPRHKKVLVLGDMYELGNESEIYHREIGEFISSLKDKISFVVTVGNHATYISESCLGVPSQHFKEKSEAARFLTQFAQQDHALLFKASRGMRLEELIDRLVEYI